MDIYEIRRLNLQKAVGGERGDTAKFAVQHEMDPSYISQILNKHRRLGEKAARKMELQAGLGRNSLDDPNHSENRHSPVNAIEQIIQEIDWLDPDAKLNFIGLLRSLEPKK